MKYLVYLSLSVLFCMSQPVVAHDVKLVYCNDLTGTKPAEDNNLTAVTATVGKFPGPKKHEKLNEPTGLPHELDTLHLQSLQGFENKFMRARFWDMSPGGVIADHCHEDRPAMVYLLQGSVHETKRRKDGGVVVNILKAGDNIAEGNGTRHWWINSSQKNVTMFAVDFPSDLAVENKELDSYPLPRVNTHRELVRHTVFRDESEFLDLANEYPLDPIRGRYLVQTRVTDVAGQAVLGFENTSGLPSISYVVSGNFKEWRSDQGGARQMGPKSHSALPNGVYNTWKNIGTEPGQIITIEIKLKG